MNTHLLFKRTKHYLTFYQLGFTLTSEYNGDHLPTVNNGTKVIKKQVHRTYYLSGQPLGPITRP